MPRISLTGGDYRAQALIASAQSCINLYGEPMPQNEGEQVQYTYYQTPGMAYYFPVATASGVVRCLYTATNLFTFAAIDDTVYALDATNAGLKTQIIGHITAGTTPVRMQDNGIACVVTDGSGNGWYFPLPANPGSLVAISDPAFYGSNTPVVLDTFLIFNRPGTNQWYVSPSNYAGNSTQFDGLYIVAKTTYPETIMALAVSGQVIWILGLTNTELWYDSGASDFPFQRMSGVAIDSGCIATYSVVSENGNIFWLGRTQHGERVVMAGSGYQARRISTFAIEARFAGYDIVSDALGMTYQQSGHTFYVLTFPTQDETWVYDVTVDIWHQRTSLGADGLQHRWRPNAICVNLTNILTGDNDGSSIYRLAPGIYADDVNTTIGARSITRTRDFPHMVSDGRRGIFRQFTVDMTSGTSQTVSLSMSADRGNTYSQPIRLSTGTTPDTYPTAWRLGLSRDAVFRVSWSFPAETALNGAFLTLEPVRS